MNYSNLWAQDASRRLGYAIDGVVTGKDLVKELQARLPKMKKAEVDAAMRKHMSVEGLTIAIVADKGQQVADTLLSGAPTGISYDTAGTPPEVVAEDDLIKRFPVPIEKENVRRHPGRQDVREVAPARVQSCPTVGRGERGPSFPSPNHDMRVRRAVAHCDL